MIYRPAAAADAAALAEFAERVFIASYEQQLPRAELTAFAHQRFTEEGQRAEIMRADGRIFLALDPELVGYAHLLIGPQPGCPCSATAPAELKRIYLDAGWLGRGIATTLMEMVEADARERGCDRLWLAVWQGNERAQAFYRKLGFAVIGEADFPVNNLSLPHYFMDKAL